MHVLCPHCGEPCDTAECWYCERMITVEKALGDHKEHISSLIDDPFIASFFTPEFLKEKKKEMTEWGTDNTKGKTI